MRKKPLTYVLILGFLMIVAGFLFNPSLLEKFTSIGKFRSSWTVAKIHLIQYYFIIFGIVLVLGSLIINRFPKEKRTSQYILGICVIGIVVTIAGLIFSPSFIERNFSPISFLEDNNINSLILLQLVVITLGCLIIFISLLIYRRKFLDHTKKYGMVFLIIVLVLYFIFLDTTYFKIQYPNNTITKLSEYGKVIDLVLGKDILLSDFEPKSTLKVERKHIFKAKFPVIDIHFHFNSEFITEEDKRVLAPESIIKSMDSLGIKMIINLDGFGAGGTVDFLIRYQRKYPERFLNFAPLWFPPNIITDDHISQQIERFEKLVKNGETNGMKLWKYLGLKTRDISGKVIPVDDPRLDPMWSKAGELGVPILWHCLDPTGSFQPVDKTNERFLALKSISKWTFYGPRYPNVGDVLKQRENVLRKHPNTIFIGAHMGYNPNDLNYLGYLLDTYANYYVDISAVLSDIGRQPYTARRFFIKYQDRILFGTDGGCLMTEKDWTFEKCYQTHFEFLETENEYFDYPLQDVVNQGDWKIYGINLPDEVLEKVYYKNAERILPNIFKSTASGK